MKSKRSSKSRATPHLPGRLRRFFWDYDFDVLSWDRDRDLIVRRILSVGSWEAVTWVRRQLGDAQLRRWIEERRGARLSPRQLRFWELILGLPRRQVDAWVAEARKRTWEQRCRR